MKKIALIPAYEPEENLIDLVQQLDKNNFITIVVNDGSNNKYDSIFNNIKPIATVLDYQTNKGKGFALKTGLEYIKNKYKKYVVVTIDSDGQHTVKDAKKLCEYAILNPDALVIGKRKRNYKIPIRSKIGNGITRVIYRAITGVNLYDTQTGLRCFSDRSIDFLLNINGNRYEYEMNVLLYASRINIKIKEIEIETIYINNNSTSHFHTITDSLKVYKEIFLFAMHFRREK